MVSFKSPAAVAAAVEAPIICACPSDAAIAAAEDVWEHPRGRLIYEERWLPKKQS